MPDMLARGGGSTPGEGLMDEEADRESGGYGDHGRLRRRGGTRKQREAARSHGTPDMPQAPSAPLHAVWLAPVRGDHVLFLAARSDPGSLTEAKGCGGSKELTKVSAGVMEWIAGPTGPKRTSGGSEGSRRRRRGRRTFAKMTLARVRWNHYQSGPAWRT